MKPGVPVWQCDYCNEVTDGPQASSSKSGGGFTRLCGCEVPEQMCHSCAESYSQSECHACERKAELEARFRAGRRGWGMRP